MSPKQFKEKFEANYTKVEAYFGEQTDHFKGFFVTNPDRHTETFLYVIAPVSAIRRYYEMVNEAYFEYQKGPKCISRRIEEYKKQGLAVKVLLESAKAFKTQPQAVKWMEGLQ